MSAGTELDRSSVPKPFAVGRELNTLLIAIIIGVSTYILAKWITPQTVAPNFVDTAQKFVGVSWPFFMLVTVCLYYVTGAWIVDHFSLGAPRCWRGISRGLHWASEACPLVGLLTTFISLLMALMVYGEAGPSNPKTQAAFISQFAIAFGSSIAGGMLALIAFTLHQLIPEPLNDGE